MSNGQGRTLGVWRSQISVGGVLALAAILSGCASYQGSVTPDGAIQFDITTTREVSDLYAEKRADGFVLSIGRASGAEGPINQVVSPIIGVAQ